VWAIADAGRVLVQDVRAADRFSFSADGRTFASAGDDGIARVWELPSGRLLASTRAARGPLGAVALDPAGRWLATGAAGMQFRRDVTLDHSGVFLWNAKSGRRLAGLPGIKGVNALAFSAAGLAAASTDLGRVHVFHPTQRLFWVRGGPVAVQDAGGRTYPPRLAFDPDGWSLAVGGHNGDVWGLEPTRHGGGLRLDVSMRVRHLGPVTDLLVGLSSRYFVVVSGSEDGTARVWHVGGHQEVVRIEHNAPVLAVCLTRDGEQVLSASADGEIRVTESPLRSSEERNRIKDLPPDQLAAYVGGLLGDGAMG
jgi:WD40 repeat protein